MNNSNRDDISKNRKNEDSQSKILNQVIIDFLNLRTCPQEIYGALRIVGMEEANAHYCLSNEK